MMSDPAELEHVASAATVELLREIRDDIRALRAAFELKSGAARLSDGDRAALSALLPVIHAATLGRSFTYHELVDHAALNVAPAIALREILAGRDARGLGRLFRRGAEHQIERYRITAVETTRSGVRWAIDCGDRSPRITASFARRVGLGSNR